MDNLEESIKGSFYDLKIFKDIEERTPPPEYKDLKDKLKDLNDKLKVLKEEKFLEISETPTLENLEQQIVIYSKHMMEVE